MDKWDVRFMKMAYLISDWSSCFVEGRKIGAVIVKDKRIMTTGYNGAPRGADNCCDVGTCWREEHDIPHGERYELCQAIHAEENAIMNANPTDRVGATLYLVGLEDGKRIKAKPCKMCEKRIKNAQIRWVVS
mgnify:CR=1 FL=1